MRKNSLFICSAIVFASLLQWPDGNSLRAQDPAEHAKSLSQAFRQAAREVQPAVVTIISHFKPSDLDPLRQLRQQPRGGRQGPEFPREGEPDENGLPTNVGSGVIFNDSGLVLTNAHVVRGAEKIVVRTSDGNEFPAADVRADGDSDIAVLKIESSTKFPVAKLGDSTKLEVGDWVIAIGSPFELEATVSAGIISAKGRTIGHIERGRLLQTDATINPGNSGGPLVNLNGEVIGINTAIATNTGVFTGVGFAIPINLAKWVSTELLGHNKVRRAWLGVSIGEITPDAAREFQVPIRGGVWLYGVIDGAPAAHAGLRQNDIIVEFGGVPVRSPGELLEAVEQQPIGSNQNVVALRKGERKTFSVKVEAYPEAELLRRRRVIPTDDASSPDVEKNDDAGKDNFKKDSTKKDSTKKDSTKKDNAKKESSDQ
jgi:serine protease Do